MSDLHAEPRLGAAGAATDAAGAAQTVSILGLEDSDPGRTDRWTLKRSEEWRLGRAEVPVDVFHARVNRFLEAMRGVIADVPAAFGKYQLDQVTISAEVSAKGQISLLGSGGELAGKSGLTFTFKRRAADDGGPDTP
jgi:hypothetical protein